MTNAVYSCWCFNGAQVGCGKGKKRGPTICFIEGRWGGREWVPVDKRAKKKKKSENYVEEPHLLRSNGVTWRAGES